MAKLIFNKKTILKNMKYAKNIFEVSAGLMFASKKKIDKGICLSMGVGNSRLACGVTMLFVFYPLDILFINSNFEVVDRKVLLPFIPLYIPKKACRYVIESTVDKFGNIKIGDKIKIHN